MSNSQENINNQEHHDSSQALSSEVTLESIHQTMTQNFTKIFETLEFLVHGQALLFGNLMLLVNNGMPMQEAPAEMDPDGFYNEPQHPVEIELPPTPTTPASSSPIESEATSTNGKHPPVKCADCGKIFIRNSLTGSISHHATNSLCRPFQCSVCKSLFKTVSFFA
jgi:hypothetical protein